MEGVCDVDLSRASSVQLTQLLQEYVTTRDMEPASIKPLRAAIRSFSEHLARPANVSDFAPVALNSWLAVEVSRVKRRTAKNYRSAIITLWRWAFEEELTDAAPRRIRPVKAPLAPVEAYTPEEVERLLAACDTLTNRFCRMRVERRLLYRALILFAFHTGFRPNDLMRLKWSQVAENGCVRITQHKTGHQVVRWVDKDTLGASEAIRMDGAELVFGRFTCLETWRSVHKGLRLAAGVTRGTPKWIRRATATAIAIKYGQEAAGLALGHLTAAMARQHYIDQSQLLSDQLRTPRLRRRKPPPKIG